MSMPWFRRCHLWVLALMLVAAGRLHAHTFTTLTADLLLEGDELSLTLGLHLLDALAIIDGKPTSAAKSLTTTQLRAGSDRVRAYLVEHVRLRVDGKLIPGVCPGYVPDLISPPKPGDPPAEFLPERVPFLLLWTLPSGTKAVEIEFALLIDLVGSGVVNASLHQGDRSQSHYANLGGTVTLTLRGTPPATKPALSTSKPATTPGTMVVTAPVSAGESEETKTISTELGVWQLLAMGFHHIVPTGESFFRFAVSLFGLNPIFPDGADHILFVASLFLLSPLMKPLLIQVTAFTLAHSVTLGLAMAGLVLLPSRLVETLIAASIVVMAVENVFVRTVRARRWILVFLFGLIHGLGFAGSFAGLQMQPGDFARPLILLNIGIELGQLTVVAGCAALTWWMWRRPWYTRLVIRPASVVIALVASWWTIERAFGLG